MNLWPDAVGLLAVGFIIMEVGSMVATTIRDVVRNIGLKVFYLGNPDAELDRAIEKSVEPFGFTFFGSGHSVTGLRDLEFRKEEEDG